METAIIIPARYGSSRFPGKPLAKIAGQTMLERVVEVAREAARSLSDVDVLVTSEDERIAKHCREIGVDCVMTSADCRTGSDRVLEAARRSEKHYDILVNLQGDAPFTPPEVLRLIMQAFLTEPGAEVVTPVKRLSWAELDTFRSAKQATPFSGTSVIVDESGQALWFSKNIIPAIRKEHRSEPVSPVFRHLGLYGFSRLALERFCALPQSRYEILEGLEQLRMIENGLKVQTVEIQDLPVFSGIDSPEDLERAEKFLSA